jgi:pimeloyl-ACP methyl ester carboxylesterase
MAVVRRAILGTSKLMRFGVVRPRDEQRDSEIRVQYRTIHGYRRAFVDVGEGPPLLLIHGIGDSSNSFEELIPSLAREHRVIAPDLLGHGRSDKPRADYSVGGYANAMRDLLSVLDVDRVSIVGHSLGGGVAMQFAYQYPHRCERLILVSSGGVCREVHPILRLAATPGAGLALSLLSLRAVRAAGRAGAILLKGIDTDIGRDADDLLRVYDTLPDYKARRAFFWALRRAIDYRGQLITMLDRCYLARNMPTLLVWGARDAVIPIVHGRIAHTAMPGSRLEVFERSGHFPHRQEPARFLSVLRDFLATTEPAVFDEDAFRSLLRGGLPYATDSPPSARAFAAKSS